MTESEIGLTGTELLGRILDRAGREGIPDPRVYSHSLRRLLHEPGPLIGLPWEQERCTGPGAKGIRISGRTKHAFGALKARP